MNPPNSLEANFNRSLKFCLCLFGLHSEQKQLFCARKDPNIEKKFVSGKAITLNMEKTPTPKGAHFCPRDRALKKRHFWATLGALCYRKQIFYSLVCILARN